MRQKALDDTRRSASVSVSEDIEAKGVDTESTLDAERFLQEYKKRLQKRTYGGGRSDAQESSYSSSVSNGSDSVGQDVRETLRVQAMSNRTESSQPRNGSAPRPSASAQQRKFRGGTMGIEPPAEGSILRFESGEIALLDRASRKHPSQLLLILEPKGAVQSKVVSLRETAFERLGHVPADDLVSIHVAQAWHREHILFHLDHFEDAPLIPAGAPGQSNASDHPATVSADWPNRADDLTPTASLPEKADSSNALAGTTTPYHLKRGQEFTIDFGENRAWKAVYWGGDGTGSLVVHDTHGEWALTRLEFKRFPKENVHPGPMLSERQVWEIEEYLKRMYT